MKNVVKPVGGLVTRLPIGPEYPGRTAGPTFELFYGVDYLLPHRDAAWAVLEERMRLLSELGTRCQNMCSPQYMPTLVKVTATLERLVGSLVEPDYAALDTLLPPPVYAKQRWIAILNPRRRTFDEVVKPLVAEAYERLARPLRATARRC